MFEFIEHTADTGLRVRAATREELFAEAARALYALLLENPADVRPAERHEITLAAGDGADLLHDWLDELLFQYSARRLIFVQFQLELEENGLRATVWGEPLDPERHRPSLDIKAITYHQLRVERAGGEWLAEVIVDI
jgi:SHS2 domain-containing protein